MKFAIISLTFGLFSALVSGHGRLMSPPSRASMWRLGFENPPDYNDNQGFCGGFAVQWGENGGKCGLCGDNWQDPTPRHHEAGGIFGNGKIVERYRPNQKVIAAVDITANHLGYLTFKLCPAVSKTQDPSQECFDANPVPVDSQGNVNYHLNSSLTGVYLPVLHLPDIECDHCVLQWTYNTGNSWGICADGTGAIGCGAQEQFRACADISILSDDSENNSEEETETTSKPEPTEVTEVTENTVSPAETTTVGDGERTCYPVGIYAQVEDMDFWCTANCNSDKPICPPEMCKCDD